MRGKESESAAAEFPGKSEQQQQRRWEVGRGIREEEGGAARRKRKKKDGVSGNKMLTAGSLLGSSQTKYVSWFLRCNQIPINRVIIHSA